MTGHPDIIDFLNRALAEELTAINQYMVHSEMCANWGYNKLHDKVEKRAFQEMKHAENLIERILFLDGQPNVSVLNTINIGKDVKQQFDNDLNAERVATALYNEGIALCTELRDAGTRELLVNTLTDEETHVDFLEAQLDQIAQMGIQNYLTEQTGE